MTTQFAEKVKSHLNHVHNVGHLCTTEETTKQALILPLLDILGFSAFDPSKVKAEHQADFPGAKAGERVDYALFCDGVPVMFVEAKAFNEKLSNHSPQLSRYFNATKDVSISAITNGSEWRFFTDLNDKNIMDKEPFLTIDFDNLTDMEIMQLSQFRHDSFQPEALKTFAEESVYLSVFTEAIDSSLKNVDIDFVRYVASKAGVQKQFTQRFLESITPIVRQAIEKSVSGMVVSGLSVSAISKKEQEEVEDVIDLVDEPLGDIVDPDNTRIVTTVAERQVFDIVKGILPEDAVVVAKDTETYFNILVGGKTNRWVVRYFDKKQKPTITLPVGLDEKAKNEILRAGLEFAAGDQIVINEPNNILRVAGLILDSYEYCSNDDNFKRNKGTVE